MAHQHRLRISRYILKTNLLRGLTHEHEALGVGNNLGSVEGLLEVIDELLLVALERLLLGTSDDLASTCTLLLDRRQATSKDSLADQGD